MSDYEREQKKLENLWQEILSGEDDCESEFGDVYTSDEYKPNSEYSSDDESEDQGISQINKKWEPKPSTSGLCNLSKVGKRRLQEMSNLESDDDLSQIKKTRKQDYGSSTSEERILNEERQYNHNNVNELSSLPIDTIDQVMEDVIVENISTSPVHRDTIDQVIDDVIDANVSDTQGLDELEWGPVERLKLKIFNYNLRDTGVKQNYYTLLDNSKKICCNGQYLGQKYFRIVKCTCTK